MLKSCSKGETKMKFDKWFNEQSRLIKVILLILPIVGWVVEILVRLSVYLRTKAVINLVTFIIAVVGNWIWSIIDLVVLIVTGHLFLEE